MTRRTFVAAAATALARAAGQNQTHAPRARFFVAALTALDGRGKLDGAMVKDYLAHLAANGVDGVLVLGTTGEFASFTVAERKQILESYARHRGRLALFAQAGAPNLPDTLELLGHAAGAGAEAALVVPPFYYKGVSTEGLARFYEPVLDSARIPVLLYNIPQLTGVPISADLLRRLSTHARLDGTKDSFSKTEAMVEFIRGFPKLKILTGVPANIAANLDAGGAGAITGNGSLFPRETAAIFEAFRGRKDALAAQKRLNERAAVIAGYDGIPAQKFALTRAGLPEMHCRPPLMDLTAEQKKTLLARLEAAGA